MKMPSRVEISMVRFLILKALMESLHLALGFVFVDRDLRRELLEHLIIVWMQAKLPNRFTFPSPKAVPIRLRQILIQLLGVMMGPACINFRSVPNIWVYIFTLSSFFFVIGYHIKHIFM